MMKLAELLEMSIRWFTVLTVNSQEGWEGGWPMLLQCTVLFRMWIYLTKLGFMMEIFRYLVKS